MNRWIEISCKIYKTLLGVYPKTYQQVFADEMMQVFCDENKARYTQNGVVGLFKYWLRIIPDLGYSAFVEHLSSPTATWGLMEPVPNKPLPWKGVFLILLPGLVYLIAQIEQFSGNTNYYVIYYRAAFFLMIPVMLVWIITKRYPVWGLIPFGLFYHLFEVMRRPMANYLSLLEVENPFMDSSRTVLSALLSDSKLLVFLSSIAICLLLWRYVKQIKKSKWVIGLLSVYFLYSLGQIINYWVFLSKYIFKAVDFSLVYRVLVNHQAELFEPLLEVNYVVLLVCIGSLFLQRHGFFSIFVYVGYMLPSLIIGYPVSYHTYLNSDMVMFVIAFALIAYRVLLSVIAPIWMARAATLKWKNRAIVNTIILALMIQIVMQFYQVILKINNVILSEQLIYSTMYSAGLTVFGFVLAFGMYENGAFTLQETELVTS